MCDQNVTSRNNRTFGSHCLVFWLPENGGEEGTTSVLKTDIIPRTRRRVGCVTKLWWNKDNKKKSYPAKILQFGDEQDLNIRDVDAFSGDIIVSSQKAFPGQIIAKRREHLQLVAKKLKAKENIKKKRAHNLISETSIFEDQDSAENSHTKKICTDTFTQNKITNINEMATSETSEQTSQPSGSNELSLDENLSALMRKLKETIYLYGI